MLSWESWKHLNRRSQTSKECPSVWGMSMEWQCLSSWRWTGSKCLWSLRRIEYSWLSYVSVIYKSTWPEITSPRWNHLRTIQAHLLWQPSFSQHVSWRCCNPPDIPSSTAEILLFNLVFHDRVTPVSVSTLKPPLRAIGVSHWNPEHLLYYQFVYKTSSYTVIH